MTGILLASLLAFTPARTAETVPSGAFVLHLDGGFGLLHVGVPVLPVVPILTGDAEAAWGLGAGVDLRARYRTDLGLLHRLGPEVRVRAAHGRGWAIAGRLWASGSLIGGAQDSIEVGGDAATEVGLLATRRYDFGALTFDVSGTVQWLLYEELEDRDHLDTEPYFLSVDVALEAEWVTSSTSNLALRFELGIPAAPDDPFTLLGVQPRITFGGSLTP